MEKELSKTYEPSQYEDDIYKKWEQSDGFKPKAGDENLKSYSIVMPPPNVTGTLHMGHASMLALEDILIRYHRMKGERTVWIPGTDHAAIATQTKVEKIIKEEGLTRHQLGREEFLKRVGEFAQNSHDTIFGQVKKMGCSCDWSREAYTLDETRSKAVRSVFKMMYDDGLIYRGERIVNWCPRCHSTLADDEVEYKDSKTKLYWIKYGPFVLATTRPETKLGDTAVAVNPSDERYKDMIGKKYNIKGVLGDFEITVIADRHVDMEFGSGAVKVTPAHSFADNEMAAKNNIPMKQIIDEDGHMMANCGKYAGMTTKEAREAIVKDMEAMGLIDHIDENYENKLSVCYRCDTAIEPLPSLQWFIDVNKKIERLGNKSLKELSIEAVKSGVFGREKINIIPERFEKNYFHWMDDLRDWCISRQIWFGHQVPVWYKGEEVYVGVEAPEGEGWVQDPDTLDTWFSSGLWTFSTLANHPDQISVKDGKLHIDTEDFKNFHPTSVLETGYDIIFFWVARMIIMTTYAVADIPFQDVYLHGLVLDDKGKKMSKSKGNIIDPLDMIERYGTDAARLSLVIGSAPGNDMRLSEEKIEGFRNMVNKLWNVSRFILSKEGRNLSNREEMEGEFTQADSWILDKFFHLIYGVTDDLDNYRFSQAGERLREFTWNDLADWYLEVGKFEQNEIKNDLLRYILINLLKLWHPFIPFVTEKIWEQLGGEPIMISQWPEPPVHEGGSNFELIKEIIISIRTARAENKIEPAKKVKAVICARDKKDLIESQIELIKNLRTGIEEVEVKESGEKIDNAIYTAVGEIEIYLLGAIDPEKEKERLKKEIENLEKFVAVIEKKLSNQEFVSNAPEAIVASEKEKLNIKQEELNNLKERLSKF